MTPFTEKQADLAEQIAVLRSLTRQLFPVGSDISWRTENSFTEHGTVISHEPERIRVVDSVGMFYRTITVADILRAQP